VTKGGRSPTGVARPASAHFPLGPCVWRSKRLGQHLILRDRKDQPLPGLHINDRQMRRRNLELEAAINKLDKYQLPPLTQIGRE